MQRKALIIGVALLGMTAITIPSIYAATGGTGTGAGG